MRKPVLVLAALLAAAALPAKGTDLAKGLKVHEWGVFTVGDDRSCVGGGKADLPDFIRRLKFPNLESPPDVRDDLPIVHVYAEQPVRLKIEIAFPQARPTVAWPEAAQAWALKKGFRGDPWPSLTWDVQAGGKDGPEPPKVPEGHWIDRLRRLGASRLTLADGSAAEDFLFYEGEAISFPDLVRLEVAAEAEALMTSKGIPEAWYVLADGKSLRICHATDLAREDPPPFPLRAVEPAALKAELTAALTKAGLAEKESQALLDIWMPELVKPGRRLVYVLPRAEYDRMLPMCITPKPEEWVRVGLVLKEIAP